MILYNGKIITVDKGFTIAEAVAIQDGKFIRVGSNNEVKGLGGADTKMIDLGGKAVVPGIIDSHVHPVGQGNNQVADVQTCDMTSLQDLLDRLAKAAAKAKPGHWITTATNWDKPQVAGIYPTLKQLDAAIPNNPLWLPRGCHWGFTNTMGMKLSRITRDSPNPIGGEILKDKKTGEATGILRGTAQRLVTTLLPPIESVQCLKKGVAYFNSLGVTAIGNDGVSTEELEAYHKVKTSGSLTLRSVLMLEILPNMSKESIFGIIDAIAYSGLKGGGLGDDLLKIVGIKTYNEVTMTGEAEWPRDLLKNVWLEAAKKEVRASVHSICAMNEENLELYREVNERFPIKNLRWVIVHQHGTTPEMIQINKELGLVVNHDLGFSFLGKGPKMWYGMMFGFPNHPGRLVAPASLWLETGVPFSLNSDGGFGNTEPSVWSSVYVSCNRNKWQDWGEKFNISRKEALTAVTMGGAFKIGMEEKIGSIEVGKLADLAVLSADPLTCSDEQIRIMNAEMTILGGKIIYERK